MSKFLLQEFFNTPWAITPDRLATMSMILTRWASGVKLTNEEIKMAVGSDPQAVQNRREANNQAGYVAVLSLYGIVSHRMQSVQDISGTGGTSTEGFSREFKQAVNNPDVGAILIDIDSPGGSVNGVEELAEEIYKARGEKKIVAIANSMAASAAYWIGSAADELVMIASGDVGSIGVISQHQDWSDFVGKPDANVAIPNIEYITAGEHKAEGNPFEPLSDDSREFMQKRVDEYYKSFVDTVARNRGVSSKDVLDNYGQGRVYGAKQALSSGMVDRVATFEETLTRLTTKRAQNNRNRSARLAIEEKSMM